jgi:hypothetical protein
LGAAVTVLGLAARTELAQSTTCRFGHNGNQVIVVVELNGIDLTRACRHAGVVGASGAAGTVDSDVVEARTVFVSLVGDHGAYNSSSLIWMMGVMSVKWEVGVEFGRVGAQWV